MLKPVFRIGGIIAIVIGLTCFPIGFGVSPKRDLSVFSSIADTGAFVKMGVTLIVGGLIAAVVSRFVLGDMD